MTTRNETPNTSTPNVSASQRPWREPGWDGPVVESRPENADPAQWPNGAAERVVFTPEAFPNYPYPDELPYVEFFGEDGWPLHTPHSVKPHLDLRMQAELRRWPWTTRPEEWNESCWLAEASDYDRFMRWNAQAGLARATLSVLPAAP